MLPRAFTVSDAQWAPQDEAVFLQHINSEEGHIRLPHFRARLAEQDVHSDAFAAAVKELYDGCHVVPFDTAAIAEEVEAFPASRGPAAEGPGG